MTVESGPAAPAAPETLHLHLAHASGRRFRESFFFHFFDPARALMGVVTLAFRPRARSGDALVLLSEPDGSYFSWVRGAPQVDGRRLTLGGLEIVLPASGEPLTLRFDGSVAAFDPEHFPPGPLRLALMRRGAWAELGLEFVAHTPLLEYRRVLPVAWHPALAPLGLDHLEQLGRFRGSLRLGGATAPVELDAAGNRDHSWGERDWLHADAWTNQAAVFEDGRAVHVLRVAVGGRLMEGGFLCAPGSVEPLVTVRHARTGPRSFTLGVVGARGGSIELRGERLTVVRFPLALSRNPFRHLLGRPWATSIEEGAAAYVRGDGAVGHGIDEAVQTRGARIG